MARGKRLVEEQIEEERIAKLEDRVENLENQVLNLTKRELLKILDEGITTKNRYDRGNEDNKTT
jgi:hypothetical protein